MTNSSLTDLGSNAIELARASSFHVHPLWWLEGELCACGRCPPGANSRGKHPILNDWTRLATTKPDEPTIRQWWAQWPRANIGAVLTAGIVVADYDPRNDPDGSAGTLFRSLPPTLEARTGSGGGHRYYLADPSMQFPGKLADGLELKQLGQQVVLPPSTTTAPYTWVALGPWSSLPESITALGYPRGERSATVVVDATEVTAPVEVLDRLAAQIAPHFVEGRKHDVAKNLGGWLKQRGFSSGDVAYVVSQLPSRDPDARIKGALAAFGIEKPFGWHELAALLPAPALAELEHTTPNPRWQAELAGRADAAALMGHLAHAPAPLITPPGASGFTPWNLSEKPAPLNYLVPALELAPGRVNMVAGYSNTGKTTITQALAFAIALGRPLYARFAVRRAKVLHLDYEAGHVALENYARLANAHGVALSELGQWLVAGESTIYLDQPDAEAKLTALVKEHRAGLVVIDVLRAAVGSLDENKAEIAKPLYMLGRVSRATGATVLILHHERKPDGERRAAAEHMISGHNAIHGALQVALSLERGADGTVTVRASKRIRGGFDPFRLRFVDVPDPNPGVALGAAIAAAGAPSWGLRVEAVTEVASAVTSPEATRATGIVEMENRILAFLAERAPDGGNVELKVIRAEVTGKNDYRVAAIERLIVAGKIVQRSRSPHAYALHVTPVFPANVAPPSVPAFAMQVPGVQS